MQLFDKHIDAGRLQIIAWTSVFVLSFLSNLQYDALAKSFWFAALTMAFYGSIIYGHAGWLIPRYYYRRKFAAYILLLVLILLVAISARTLIAWQLANAYPSVIKVPLNASLFLYGLFSGMSILLFSILYRLTLNYFVLDKKQQEITAERTITELALLKQRVHPHFLFNTLNHIYYTVEKDAPEAAGLIDRLSGIMRYFIEESPKDSVPLADEIELIKSYIELEIIRLRYEMPVDLKIDGNIKDILIPSLLLIPIIENIFKHGIDRRSRDNFAEIRLTVLSGRLVFVTRNRSYTFIPEKYAGKQGLANLERRLELHFGKHYQLSTGRQADIFTVTLDIPIHEN
jgi:sensor histidine kinase YesM